MQTPSATNSAAPPSPADTRVVELFFNKDLSDPTPLGIAMALIGFAVAIAFAVIIATFGGGGRAGGIISLFVIIALSSMAVLIYTRTRKANIDKLLEPFPTHELEHHIAATLEKLRSVDATNSLHELVRVLAQRGVRGVAFRTIRDKTPPFGPVITVPFEPRPLDTCGTPDAATDDGSAGENRDLTFEQRVKRNVLLKGGWVLVAIFGFNWLMAVIDSYRRGRPEMQLYVWSLALLAIFLAPVGKGGWWWRTGQFLVVPGGIVRRKARPWSQKWEVHLYDRRRSVLLVCNLRKSLWGLFVADGEQVDSTIGTREEMDYVLRAWASPIEPPKLEWVSGVT